MKLTKGQGISIFAAAIAFVIFSIAIFVLPMDRGIVFWMGYAFAIYAFIVMVVSAIKFFGKQSDEDKFFNVPVMVLSWLFLVSQVYLTYREITALFLPYTIALLVNLGACFVFTVLILAVAAYSNRIKSNAEKVAEKVLFIDNLKNQLSALDSGNAELKKKIKTVVEEVTYSDPMSHSELAEDENLIIQKIGELSDRIADEPVAISICDEIVKLLKNRNNRCLTLKRVKDTKVNDNDKENGNKIAIAGVAAALGIALAVLALVLYIVPEMKYKDACKMVENGEYDEAIVIFTELKSYKDSKEKIEEIANIRKEAEYNDAIKLMQDCKYDEAIDAFTKLNGYKDSDSKINEIGEIIYKEKYDEAEAAFLAGDYDKAMELYKQMIMYKNSRDRIIEIKNRTATDDIIYLGIYENEPIAWRIVELNGYTEALLIAEQPIRNLPISDDIKDVSYENSDIAKWLEETFIAQFTETDFAKIIKKGEFEVFLLGEDDVNRLTNNGVDLSTTSDWWICTESRIGFKYVTADGKIATGGDLHLRDKGVRPAIWIKLK